VRARKFTKSAPVQAALARWLIGGLSLLPFGLARGCGTLLGNLLWYCPNRLRHTSESNIRLCFPELSDVAQRRLARASLIETAKNVTEAGAVWRWPVDKLVTLEERAEGEDILRSAMEKGRGVLLLAPHLGNWEFLSISVQARMRVISLYRPPRIRELDEFIRARRQRIGAEMVPADEAGLRRFLKALRSGRLCAILPDQEPLKQHGVFAPFFGQPALTMTLASRLLRRYQAAPVFAYAQRVADGRFRVHFREAPSGLDDPDPETAAARLNLGVERCVRNCPEQYMWSYRRFRTQRPAVE
jgi:KDO2-lipid IV(A) lauroyltransferase